MFERLSQLYNAHKITVEQLEIAVIRGWITTEQKELIVVISLKEVLV